ncbi:hypothetical protein CLM62_30490 [Streptomyces sp. SA15]|nr:hypothetical protein CLM62_30490 [Streptomyces sp. SA15]
MGVLGETEPQLGQPPDPGEHDGVSDPENDDYRRLCTVAFGKPLTLPEPFAFDLDTTDLL